MLRRLTKIILPLALSCALAPAVFAAAEESAGKLPVPRFVSLRSGEVNLRTGPGTRYPVDWVYQKPTLPVEVVEEYDDWRRIRDWEGSEGWVHKSMLSGRRYAMAMGQIREMRRKPEAQAGSVARLSPGVVLKVLECKSDWCKAEVSDIRGWVRRGDVFGIYASEEIK